jgi:hypothetical protein
VHPHQYPRKYNRDLISTLLAKHSEGEDRLTIVCREYEADTGERLERAPLQDLIRRRVVGTEPMEERPPKRYVVASIVEGLLHEDPWLLLHPGDLYKAYRRKTFVPCSDYTLRRWIRANGIAAAQRSPHYEADLLEQIPARRLKRMVVPQPLKDDQAPA